MHILIYTETRINIFKSQSINKIYKVEVLISFLIIETGYRNNKTLTSKVNRNRFNKAHFIVDTVKSVDAEFLSSLQNK